MGPGKWGWWVVILLLLLIMMRRSYSKMSGKQKKRHQITDILYYCTYGVCTYCTYHHYYLTLQVLPPTHPPSKGPPENVGKLLSLFFSSSTVRKLFWRCREASIQMICADGWWMMDDGSSGLMTDGWWLLCRTTNHWLQHYYWLLVYKHTLQTPFPNPSHKHNNLSLYILFVPTN